MTISYPTVGSVLNEQPPADGSTPPFAGHPALPTNRITPIDPTAAAHRRDTDTSPPVGRGPATHPAADALALLEPSGRPAPNTNTGGELGVGDFEVVYDDADGYPLLAFADGHWFDVTSLSPRPVSVRHALRRDPAWAGAVVQASCLWMRANPSHERSFDLATELSLAVGELVRQ